MKAASDLKITVSDGSFDCYVARPPNLSAAVVVVIQEIFGITPFLRAVADRLASGGHIAVVPDLFWRIEPGIVLNPDREDELNTAFGYYQRFDLDRGLQDLTATVKTARTMRGASGKVGCLGYCLGGKLAFDMASESDVDCSVAYYGVSIENELGKIAKIRHPLLMHFAELDKFVSIEAQKRIADATAANKLITVHSYAGVDHGFARTGSMHYNEEAAALANARSSEFLQRYLR